MIPIKLQLKNFLSYGPTLQTVNFGQYPLICLAGKNGHGKSALLDAITWAIWGQARKTNSTSKADKGLLRLGQTQMQVILEFECNNQHYRIRREFAISYGKSYATLDFGVFDSIKKNFIPLTDKTIRKTQKKIENTIHLDFESFTNSAFLRQGQANEFSQKMPKDRKEILATILGLNEYEQIKKLAGEKMRASNSERKAHVAIQEKRAQELEYKSALEKELVSIAKQLDELKKKEHNFDAQTKKQHKEKELLLECKKNYEILLIQLKQIEEKKSEQHKFLRELFNTWRSVHKQQIEQTDVHDITEKKEQLTQEIKEHQLLLQKSLQLKELTLKKKEELQKITQEIAHTYAQKMQKEQMQFERLIIQKKNNLQHIDVLHKNKKAQKEEFNSCIKTIEELKKTLTQNTSDNKKQEKEIKQFERRKEYYQRYIAQGNYTKQELDALQQKKALAHDESAPSCSLCEQDLSATRRRFLKQKFATQQHFLEHRFIRLSTIIKNLKAVLIEQHKTLEHAKKSAEKQNAQQAQYDELQKTHKKLCVALEHSNKQIKIYEKSIQESDAKIFTQEKIVKQLEKNKIKNLESNQAYRRTYTELEKLNKEIEKNSYNPKKHKQMLSELEKVEKLHKQQISFLQELSKQPERRQRISALCIDLKKSTRKKIALKKLENRYKKDFEKENILKKEEAALIQKRHLLMQEKEKMLQQKGRFENQKEKLTQVEKEFKQEEKALKTLQQTIDDYQAISTATGKDGIQALLIEDAIPEIEQEANSLLAKLTDNQAQIIIESLRDLKKGGTRETLDIKISDGMGIRPYEMFSGGEAFRIDFALRIAISKLLARRAGTSLQTLIIDEGFGSQDEEGLSRIMDAIYKIQEDFCKVIIVSHLTTMKDQFPVHFFVQKGASGSVVKVIEQG